MRNTIPKPHRFPVMAAALLGALAACSDPSTTSPPEFSLTPTSQWSGGQVLLRSRLFDRGGTLPTITAAGIPMTVTRLDDSTLAAVLPDLPTQTAQIEVHTNSSDFSVGTVQVYGFRTWHDVSPGFNLESAVVTTAGGPVVLGGNQVGGLTSEVVMLDLRNAFSQVLADVVSPRGGRGPLQSYLPGSVILGDTSGTLNEYLVTPILTLADTVPTVPFSRQAAHVSPGVWLFTESHWVTVHRAGAPDIRAQQEDTHGLAISSAADRFVPSNFGTINGGTYVFRATTGDTLFRLDYGVHDVVFNAAGSTMFVLTEPSEDRLVRADPETGVTELEVPVVFPPGTPARTVGIGLSRDESRLYLAANIDGIVEVQVFDPETLTLQATVRAIPGSACCSPGYPISEHLVIDEATATIYVVSSGYPLKIMEFDILP